MSRRLAGFSLALGALCVGCGGGRGITEATLQNRRFSGSLRSDGDGNVIFPHRDRDGICGFERKGAQVRFTGQRGLWISRCFREDATIVVAESGIDVLSYHQLRPDPNTR